MREEAAGNEFVIEERKEVIRGTSALQEMD